ncbi:MAG: BamA/TamA family outer membrane protein [Candidatus Kapabacteria bacterium]|nr:BamA/TamA family outer membrane protein [Candidatus Kapabacteria bacterium]
MTANFRLFMLVLINILFLFLPVNASNNIDNYNLFPAGNDIDRFEIGSMEFSGNNRFKSSELAAMINTRASKLSVPRMAFGYYYEEINKTPVGKRIFPNNFMKNLKLNLDKMADEISWYDEREVAQDVLTLTDIYNRNGYHKVAVTYKFEPDSAQKINVITFVIEENTSFLVNYLEYTGLDSLPPALSSKVNKLRRVKIGHIFNENKILSEISSIRRKLLDNGYYYCAFSRPTVRTDTALNIDSIYVKFTVGNRLKIAHVQFVDSTMGQHKVANSMKRHLMEFQEGQYYSKSKISKTLSNLLELGTFNMLTIDTSSHFFPISDSTLSLVVYSRYKKQKDWGLSIYGNQTIEDIYKGGAEGTFFHRNLFGGAQAANFFTRIETKDPWDAIKRWFGGTYNPDYEWQVGFNMSQPFLTNIGTMRVGFSTQLVFSELSQINTDLKIRTFSFPLKFPLIFADYTYINAGSVDLLFEWQAPINLQSAKEKAFKNVSTNADSTIIEQSFMIYESLDQFNEENLDIRPTSIILSGTMISDNRNNMFTPSKGHYTVVSTDIAYGGVASYIRPQISYSYFTKLNKYTVFAMKARGGYSIILSEEKNAFIPIERQFFAGGGNSVRGWASRRLRYPMPNPDDYQNNSDLLGFFQDFVGSKMLIEGTAEVRWKIGRPQFLNKSLANIADMMVLTGFVDVGNSFYWMADKYEYEAYEFITGLAASVGIGAGFLTPVGPFRFDFAWKLYDPYSQKLVIDKWRFFTNKAGYLYDMEFHIGLGYAF